MYITVYTVGAMFAALLFTPDPMGSWKWMTWVFATIEWTVCTACIAHGVLVAKRLSRERMSKTQVDDDERVARELESA